MVGSRTPSNCTRHDLLHETTSYDHMHSVGTHIPSSTVAVQVQFEGNKRGTRGEQEGKHIKIACYIYKLVSQQPFLNASTPLSMV